MKIVTQVLALLLPALLMPQLAAAVNGAVFGDLPSCALTCLISSLGESACSVSNTTCMCLDTKLLDDSTTCILANCTALEALSAKNITAIGCDQPVRDKGGAFIVTATTLAVISGVFLVTRLSYRVFVVRSIGWDDWVATIGFFVVVLSTVIMVQGLTANGLGRDVWTLPSVEIYRFVKFFYIVEILYFTDVTFLKLTILFFYLRIFPTKGVRSIIWGTIGFVVLYGLTFIFVGIFQCHPISYYWTNWDGEHTGTCLSVNAIGWANAAINIVLDFWMLAVPLYQLRKLHLHWKKKLGVGIMFTMGTFVTVVSILRLRSLLSFANSMNLTWDNYEVVNWSTIEINVGIICACLPSTRLILVHFFPGVLGSSSHGYNSNNHHDDQDGNGNNQRNGGIGGGSNNRIGGAGNRVRSIPLVSTASSRHQKGTNTTVITTINAHDEEDDLGIMHEGRFGRSNSAAGIHGPLGGGGAQHGQKQSIGGTGAGGGPGGILYQKSYAVNYGSEYNDEARLVYERGQQGNSSKSDLKSSRGSESSL